MKYLNLVSYFFIFLCLAVSEDVNNENDTSESFYLLNIDLGSTNIVANLNSPNLVKAGADQKTRIIIPSAVAFTNNGILVGERAKEQYSLNPSNTIIDIRKYLGLRHNDPIIQDAIKHSQLNIKKAEDEGITMEVELNNEKILLTPEEIAAILLKEAKEWLLSILSSEKSPLPEVVVVPDNFNDNQRKAIKDAGEIAGLRFYRIHTMPTTAVKAYKMEETEVKLIVYHLGGNTLQATLVDYYSGVDHENDSFVDVVEKVDGQIGGSYFDQRVVDYFVEKYKADSNGVDISKYPLVLGKLKRQVENAKILLSNSTLAHIEIHDPFFGDNNNGTFSEILTRETFEQLSHDLFDKSIQYIDDLLLKSNTTIHMIKGVVLSGGSIHIPKISTLLKDYFKDNDIYNTIDPIYVNSCSYMGLIWDLSVTRNPILYTIESSYGVEATGGVMTKVLEQGSELPVKRTLVYSTAIDNQTSVKIRIFRGERILTKHNAFVKEIKLTGIKPAPRGTTLIDITFIINNDGLFFATVKDLSSGHFVSTIINSDYKLRDGDPYSTEEDTMIKEQINSECVAVDDPLLQWRFANRKIWGLPNCKIMLLDPTEDDDR